MGLIMCPVVGKIMSSSPNMNMLVVEIQTFLSNVQETNMKAEKWVANKHCENDVSNCGIYDPNEGIITLLIITKS